MTITINPPTITPWPYGDLGVMDHLGSGELGGLQYVSGSRIARRFGCQRYYGHIYVGNLIGTDAIRRDFRDRVCFTIVPYESTRCRGASPGPAQTVTISTIGERVDGSTYERNDYELWNLAACHLYAASDRRTLGLGQLGPWHFQQGRWRCRLCGVDGVDVGDSVARWQSIPKGWFADRLNIHADRLHFLAEDRDGNQLRLRYVKQSNCDGYRYSLEISQPVDVGRHYDRVPLYLSKWIDSRCF